MKTLPPMPGTPVRAACETLRRVSAHSASSSAPSWPILVETGRHRRRPRRAAVRSSSIDWSSSPTKAVPRSKPNVTIVTRQPSFSSPTRLATGTRTSSRNSSANSVDPAMVRSGRTSMPGVSIGMTNQVMPLCRESSVPVRTSSSQKSATSAWLVQILVPLTT